MDEIITSIASDAFDNASACLSHSSPLEGLYYKVINYSTSNCSIITSHRKFWKELSLQPIVFRPHSYPKSTLSLHIELHT